MRVLGFYLAAKFMLWIAITGMVFIAIAFLGDFLEMLKLATRHNQGTNAALYYSWLRLRLWSSIFCRLFFCLAASLPAAFERKPRNCRHSRRQYFRMAISYPAFVDRAVSRHCHYHHA